MKLAVITAGFYDRDYDQKFERLKWSADNFEIPIQVYGRKEFFSFFDSKINKLGVAINNMKNKFTHVLYTDFADSFFLTGLDEIIKKYEALGEPKLMVSGERTIYPYPEFAELFPDDGNPYRFMNPGNFIAEIPAILEALNYCKRYYNLQSNDQGHWMQAFAEYKFPLAIDSEAQIFQTMADCHFEDEFEVDEGNGRLYNKVTKTFPCIVHFNGPKGHGTENERISTIVFDKVKEYHENI